VDLIFNEPVIFTRLMLELLSFYYVNAEVLSIGKTSFIILKDLMLELLFLLASCYFEKTSFI